MKMKKQYTEMDYINDLARLFEQTQYLIDLVNEKNGFHAHMTQEPVDLQDYYELNDNFLKDVTVDDIEVRVAPDGRTASATCDATVAGDSAWGSAEEVREVRARLVRKGGRWVFSSAEVVPIVRK